MWLLTKLSDRTLLWKWVGNRHAAVVPLPWGKKMTRQGAVGSNEGQHLCGELWAYSRSWHNVGVLWTWLDAMFRIGIGINYWRPWIPDSWVQILTYSYSQGLTHFSNRFWPLAFLTAVLTCLSLALRVIFNIGFLPVTSQTGCVAPDVLFLETGTLFHFLGLYFIHLSGDPGPI